MTPLTAAIIFGIGSFGIAKMSGASTKKAIGIGALAALGGAGLAQAGVLGGAGATTASGGLTAKQVALQEAAKYSGGPGGGVNVMKYVQTANAPAVAGAQPSLFAKGVTAFKGMSPAAQLGTGVAGASLVGGLMAKGPEGEMMPGMMGTEEDYAQAYARARKDAEGLSQRPQYTDQGGFVAPSIYAAKGGLAELKKFSQGGVNYLPSKTDHDEKDMNNYVRAEGYVEDGSGNGDKDEDTMLAQLADGEFVSRADAVLGAGILAGADPKDFKQMRRVGAKFFYNQQDQLKRVYDLAT
tara:strand:+ start:431 stop:1318 length:888 start_codon:yes stop_codon:yes gene_type:complete